MKNQQSLKNHQVIQSPTELLNLFKQGKAGENFSEADILEVLQHPEFQDMIGENNQFIYDLDRLNLDQTMEGLSRVERQELLDLISYFWNKIRAVVTAYLQNNGLEVVQLKQQVFPKPLAPKAPGNKSIGPRITTPWSPIVGTEQVCKIAHDQPIGTILRGIDIFQPIQHENLSPEKVTQLASGEIVSTAPNLSGYQTLYERKLLPPYQKIQYLLDGMKGTLQLHQAGYAHCDIKPANVLIINGKGVLIDLESVVMIDQEENPDYITDRYHEYFYYKFSQRIYDASSDVFSWGVSILNVFFPEIEPEKQINQIRSKRPYLSHQEAEEILFNQITYLGTAISSPMADLVKSMVQVNRSKRPTLQAAIEELTKIQQNFNSSFTPPTSGIFSNI